MGIDPELQVLLDDLRAGYGNERPERDAKDPAADRMRDWELRTGYSRRPAES